jgi:hypothetical protein
MWRKLFSRLSILSVVLCLGCLGWWYRTSSNVDELAYHREDVEVLRLAGSGGKVALTHTLYDANRSRLGAAKVYWDSASGTDEPSVKSTTLGFAYRSQPRGSGGRDSTLVVPMWMLSGLFAVMPLTWVWCRVRRNQKIDKLKGKHE